MTLTPAAEVAAGAGGLCRKGWTSADLLRSPHRLTSPLVRDRKGGPLREAGWDEALDRVVAGIRKAQLAGPDGVAVFGGGGLTNEKAYALGKFARVALRTSQIDYNGRFCMSSAAAAGNRAFGVDRGMPFPLSDLGEADCVLLVGSNPAETMPPFVQHLGRLRAAGGSVVVIDPRRTATAEQATLHLAPQPGTDLALANGMLFVALDGVRGRPGRRGRLVAGPGRARHRRQRARPAGSGEAARPGGPRHGPHRPWRRAARPRHRHRLRLDQPLARPRPARHPRCRLGHPHRPGQRPGRP